MALLNSYMLYKPYCLIHLPCTQRSIFLKQTTNYTEAERSSWSFFFDSQNTQILRQHEMSQLLVLHFYYFCYSYYHHLQGEAFSWSTVFNFLQGVLPAQIGYWSPPATLTGAKDSKRQGKSPAQQQLSVPYTLQNSAMLYISRSIQCSALFCSAVDSAAAYVGGESAADRFTAVEGPGTRDQGPGTRDQEQGTRNQGLGTRDWEPGTRQQDQGQLSVQLIYVHLSEGFWT